MSEHVDKKYTAYKRTEESGLDDLSDSAYEETYPDGSLKCECWHDRNRTLTSKHYDDREKE